jgi:hypothetical protein
MRICWFTEQKIFENQLWLLLTCVIMKGSELALQCLYMTRDLRECTPDGKFTTAPSRNLKTREEFEKAMDNAYGRYLAGTMSIKAYTVTCFDRSISLENFHLKKGVYFLQVVYYAGKALATHTVGQDQISHDEQLYSAELYQGCAESNMIVMVVE